MPELLRLSAQLRPQWPPSVQPACSTMRRPPQSLQFVAPVSAQAFFIPTKIPRAPLKLPRPHTSHCYGDLSPTPRCEQNCGGSKDLTTSRSQTTHCAVETGTSGTAMHTPRNTHAALLEDPKEENRFERIESQSERGTVAVARLPNGRVITIHQVG